jgi:hypothetical protein
MAARGFRYTQRDIFKSGSDLELPLHLLTPAVAPEGHGSLTQILSEKIAP